MEKVDVKELDCLSQFNFGSFCKIYRCAFNNSEYVYKEFNKPRDFFDSDFEKKFDALNNLKLKRSQLPVFIVNEENSPKGYLSFPLEDEDYSVADISSKLYILKETQKAITELHQNGIIHTDIHAGNIILSDNNITLIDYDNCHYKNFKPQKQYYSDFARAFVEKYGLGKDLDIYLFNLFAYSFLNEEFDYLNIIRNISKGNYGIFVDKESKKVCNSLTLDTSYFNNQYLIDTIDCETIEKTLMYK